VKAVSSEASQEGSEEQSEPEVSEDAPKAKPVKRRRTTTRKPRAAAPEKSSDENVAEPASEETQSQDAPAQQASELPVVTSDDVSVQVVEGSGPQEIADAKPAEVQLEQTEPVSVQSGETEADDGSPETPQSAPA
jgi:hypothetical protein